MMVPAGLDSAQMELMMLSGQERSGGIKPLNYSHTSEKNEKERGSHPPRQS